MHPPSPDSERGAPGQSAPKSSQSTNSPSTITDETLAGQVRKIRQLVNVDYAVAVLLANFAWRIR
jgi:hypothetical protein